MPCKIWVLVFLENKVQRPVNADPNATIYAFSMKRFQPVKGEYNYSNEMRVPLYRKDIFKKKRLTSNSPVRNVYFCLDKLAYTEKENFSQQNWGEFSFSVKVGRHGLLVCSKQALHYQCPKRPPFGSNERRRGGPPHSFSTSCYLIRMIW